MENLPEKQTHLIIVPLMLAAAYAGVGANMQGFFSLLPLVSEEFALSRAQAGLYSSFYFLSATSVAVFSGRFVDMFGARKGLVLGVSGVGAVMIAVSSAPDYRSILGLAFICGLVFSVITPSVSRGIIEYTSASRRAFSMGIAHSGGNSGGMAAAALLPLIAGSFGGWRVAIRVSALSAILVAAFLWSRYPAGNGPDRGAQGRCEPKPGFRDSFAGLMTNPGFLAVCILGILLGCAMSSVGVHFTLFLSNDFGIKPVRAGVGLAFLQAGGVAGMSGWGLISDRMMRGERNATLSLLTVSLCLVSLLMALAVRRAPLNYPAVFSLAFVTGFICLGSMALFFTSISETADEDRTGMATGIALIFSRAGVIVGPPVFGKIADINGTYLYSWAALGIAAACFAVVFAVFTRALRTGRK